MISRIRSQNFNLFVFGTSIYVLSNFFSLEPCVGCISVVILLFSPLQHDLHSRPQLVCSACPQMPVALQVRMCHYLAFKRIIVVEIQFLRHFLDEAVFFVREVGGDRFSVRIDVWYFFVFIYWTLVDFPVCNTQVFVLLKQVLLAVLYTLDVAFPPNDLFVLDPEYVSLPPHICFFFAYLFRNCCDLIATETSTGPYERYEILFGPWWESFAFESLVFFFLLFWELFRAILSLFIDMNGWFVDTSAFTAVIIILVVSVSLQHQMLFPQFSLDLHHIEPLLVE